MCSPQDAPFHTQVINATVRDATDVLDGLLHHESDLRIVEHSTDTAGFTDHLFALMHLLGFRFAPRIRDLADKRLYLPGGAKRYPTLAGLIGGSLNMHHIRAHWDEVLRLATSIKQGTVTASLMLRKLGSYPRQTVLAVALHAPPEHAGSPALQVKRAAGRAWPNPHTLATSKKGECLRKAPHSASTWGSRARPGRTTSGGAWDHGSYPTPSGATKPFTLSAGEPTCLTHVCTRPWQRNRRH